MNIVKNRNFKDKIWENVYRQLFCESDLYLFYVQMDHFVILNEKSFFDCAMLRNERGDKFKSSIERLEQFQWNFLQLLDVMYLYMVSLGTLSIKNINGAPFMLPFNFQFTQVVRSQTWTKTIFILNIEPGRNQCKNENHLYIAKPAMVPLKSKHSQKAELKMKSPLYGKSGKSFTILVHFG